MDWTWSSSRWPGAAADFQQVVWELWITALPTTQEVLVRRCYGIRDMFVIDVPGHGRLWPAHGKPPWKLPVAASTFQPSGLAWVGIAVWSVHPQMLVLLKYGPQLLAVSVLSQAAILLMLGVAFTGIANQS